MCTCYLYRPRRKPPALIDVTIEDEEAIRNQHREGILVDEEGSLVDPEAPHLLGNVPREEVARWRCDRNNVNAAIFPQGEAIEAFVRDQDECPDLGLIPDLES